MMTMNSTGIQADVSAMDDTMMSAAGGAGNHRATALLLGLGLRSFSMSPSAVPRVKNAIRELELDHCIGVARAALGQTDVDGVRALLGR